MKKQTPFLAIVVFCCASLNLFAAAPGSLVPEKVYKIMASRIMGTENQKGTFLTTPCRNPLYSNSALWWPHTPDLKSPSLPAAVRRILSCPEGRQMVVLTEEQCKRFLAQLCATYGEKSFEVLAFDTSKLEGSFISRKFGDYQEPFLVYHHPKAPGSIPLAALSGVLEAGRDSRLKRKRTE